MPDTKLRLTSLLSSNPRATKPQQFVQAPLRSSTDSTHPTLPENFAMRFLKFAFVVALMSFTQTGHASEEDRATLIARFTHTLGIEQVIATSQQQSRQATTAQKELLLGNFRRAGISESAVAEIGSLFDEMVETVLTSWNPQEASRIYTGVIAESMSDDDLRKAIAFYGSSEGQKSVSVAGEANRRLQQYIQSSMTKAMQPALESLMAKVQAIAAADRQKQAGSTQ
jgi:hypothetical protein